MRVYNVKQYAYAQAVGSINEFFEFFRGTKARTYRKEVSHLITKRTVVRVFLYCHQLDSVVTQSSNAREYIEAELYKSTHTLVFGTHPDMRFVDKWMWGSFGARMLPMVGMIRAPHLGGEHFGIVVLHSAGSM